MSFQSTLLFVLLLIPSIYLSKINRLIDPSTVPVCSVYDTDGFFVLNQNCDDPTDLCGINRTTGLVPGCVPASFCPVNITNRNIVCHPNKTHCCCKGTLLDIQDGLEPCNSIFDPQNDTIWKEACAIPELNGSDICRVSPAAWVFCASDADNNNYRCPPILPYCGVDRITGNVQSCVNVSSCPEIEFGNRLVTCSSDKPNCCCQSFRDLNTSSDELACNNLLHRTNHSVWHQACMLPELRKADACKTGPGDSGPGTTVTVENMLPVCRNICKHDWEEKHQSGPFTVYCGYPHQGMTQEFDCPELCPQICDRYCVDGYHLHCPAFHTPVDASKEMKEQSNTTLYILIAVGAIIALLLLFLVVYLCYFKKHQRRRQLSISTSRANRRHTVHKAPRVELTVASGSSINTATETAPDVINQEKL